MRKPGRALLLAASLVTLSSSHADTPAPERNATPPRCGSRTYRAMTDTTERHCREQAGAARSKCDQLVRELRACTAEIRTEPQSLTFQIALGGEWTGARFEHRAGGWVFVSFVGGDIP